MNVDSETVSNDNFAGADSEKLVTEDDSIENSTTENPMGIEIVIFADNYRSDKNLETDYKFYVIGILQQLSL